MTTMRMSLSAVAAVLLMALGGCRGGGQEVAGGPLPIGDDGPGETLEIGPLLVRTE